MTITDHGDLAAFISNLELSYPSNRYNAPKTTFRGAAPDQSEIKLVEGEEQSFLSDKSMLSFVSNVSEQNRKDVLNSTLLAQLAANKKAGENDIFGWYHAFCEVLHRLGWDIENSQLQEYKSSKDVFEVRNVIISLLTSAFGGDYLGLITKTLQGLSDSDGKISAFEQNSHAMNKGCFQMGIATEENNAVSLKIGSFLLESEEIMHKILFVSFSKDRTKLNYQTCTATLNTDTYSAVREDVSKKLQEQAKNYLAEISI